MYHILYIVGQVHQNSSWTFKGVFSTKELADDMCKDVDYFYTEAELDQELPHETTCMDNIWFPRCEIPNQQYYVVCPVHGVWCTTYDISEVAPTCILCGSELSFKPMYP